MRILHTLDYWARGYGRGDAVFLLADIQAQAGHKTRVVIADCFDSREKEALRHWPEAEPRRRRAHRQLDPEWQEWLLAIADQFQPDIIHTHELSDSWALAGAVPCPVVLSIRVDYRRLPAAPLLLQAASRCDWVEYWNPDIAGWLMQSGIRKISWNCAPTVFQKSPNRSPERGLLVSQGRLDSLKNQAALINSMPEILEHVPEARLWLVGKGPALNALKDHAQQLGLGEAVVFYGWQDDVVAYLQKAHLALYPGASMGFDRAIMEAMSVGVPTITSPALSPVTHYGKYGLIAEDWAQATIAALNDSALEQTIGPAGKACAEQNYSPEAVLARTMELYNKLLRWQTQA